MFKSWTRLFFVWEEVPSYHKLVIWISKPPNLLTLLVASWFPKIRRRSSETTTIDYDPIFHRRFVENSATMVSPTCMPCSQRKCPSRSHIITFPTCSRCLPAIPLHTNERATHCALPERRNAPGPCFWPGSCRDAQVGYVGLREGGQLCQTWSQQIDFQYVLGFPCWWKSPPCLQVFMCFYFLSYDLQQYAIFGISHFDVGLQLITPQFNEQIIDG